MDSPVYLREIPASARLLYVLETAIRWSDMDAFGHVNNAVYFTYFEQARVNWLDSIGQGHALVLANVSCTFLQPILYPAAIEVRLLAANPGRSSLDTYYSINHAGSPEQPSAVGHGTLVWYDHQDKSTLPIPEPVRQMFD